MSKVMKVELWNITKLIPYEKNAKKHPEEQIVRLAATIKRFGWDQPIVVDSHGVIIKGHGRRLAALHLGLEQVPVLVRTDMTPAEADAARIADNAVIGLQFDTRMMEEELRRLMADKPDFTVDDLGLSDKDREMLLEKLDDPEASAIMEDTHGEIERQANEDSVRIEKSDAEAVRLAEAFGFKTFTRAETRIVANFVAEAEAQTGKVGSEAFIEFLGVCLA